MIPFVSLEGKLNSSEKGFQGERQNIASRRVNCCVNPLTTKKQTTKFSSANFQKMLSPNYIILRIQRRGGQTV